MTSLFAYIASDAERMTLPAALDIFDQLADDQYALISPLHSVKDTPLERTGLVE